MAKHSTRAAKLARAGAVRKRRKDRTFAGRVRRIIQADRELLNRLSK